MPAPNFSHRINKALQSRREKGLERRIRPVIGGNQTELECQGRRYFNFSSNDYLGLANDPELVKAWQQGLSVYGSGSGASPLVTGFTYAHQNLEASLCDWLGYERAILFNSGFSANQAVLFSLLEKDDLLLQDKLNHASLMEAGMLSPASMKRFRHNDTNHLNTLLNSDCANLVVTEGVFSMDGDIAPLKAIQDKCLDRAWLVVDDAHGIGVLGKEGRGSCETAQITPDILVVTFGKAFGLSGAAVLCRHNTGDYLTQFARHHVYSTAMPPAQAHTLTHAVAMIRGQQWRRDNLLELSQLYRELLSDLPQYRETQTPIKPFVIGKSEATVKAASYLRQQGLWLTAIRPPTVPNNTARLRITLTANHTKKQIKTLAAGLRKAIEKQGDAS
ncbi:8-amino-7-oxononanoate synthase [Vibrio astriarenae]|uniref:8-amino-7-oxononanoate synthase n=1 Tax=Vibrio astriarenae TaxID=1481923 RepID=UPI003736B948